MPGLPAFPASADGALATVGSIIARTDSRKAWIVLALAVLTAACDRFAVVGVASAACAQDDSWRSRLAVALAAIAGAAVIGRWVRTVGLALAERVADTVLLAATHRLAAAEWDVAGPGDAATTVARIAAAMRADACQVAAALPAFLALPVTVGWLAVQEPAALPVIGITSAVGALLLRRDLGRARAGQTVLSDAEAAFDTVAGRVLGDALATRLPATERADLCSQSLWPVVDDATRAASIQAEAHARVAGQSGWLAFLVVIVLLTFAPGGGPDPDWTRALLVVAATLQPALQASAAYRAGKRVAAAASRIDAFAGRFPAAQAPAAAAPARWATITLRGVRVRQRDMPHAFLAGIGPLDLELRHGEIIAVIGPNPHDRATLCKVLSGLVAPDEGAVLLDGRPIPPSMLRGLFGGVADPAPPSGTMQALPATTRAGALARRFGLPRPLSDQAETAGASVGAAERVRLAIVATDLEDRSVRIYGDYASYLDPAHRGAFTETLQAARARGRTSVVATSAPEIIAIADRVLTMQDGHLIAGTGAAP